MLCCIFHYFSLPCETLKCSPANPALQGLNIGGGAEVKLRLRRPNNEWDFYPYEQILDTMLHELCHNEYGPHNADFYKLLEEIRRVISYSPFMFKLYHMCCHFCRRVNNLKKTTLNCCLYYLSYTQ